MTKEMYRKSSKEDMKIWLFWHKHGKKLQLITYFRTKSSEYNKKAFSWLNISRFIYMKNIHIY